MGNQQRQNLNQNTLSDYQVCMHPFLKPAKLVTTNKGESLLELRIQIRPNLNLDPWINKKYQVENRIRSKFLFLPIKIAIQSKLCGSQQIVVFYYEPFIFSLDHEIITRRSKKSFFTQEQLWYLLYTGVSVIAQFEIMGQRIGKLRPQNILLNQKGHIRFVNQYSWPGQSLSQIPQTITERCYLAPEQFGNHFNNKSKSDIFSLSLVLLQCMTLYPIMNIYHNSSFDHNEFGRLLEEIDHPIHNQQYSYSLKQMIRRILRTNFDERPFAKTILEQLRHVEGKIVKFKKFT